MEELKPMNLGALYDRTYRLLFNKKFLIFFGLFLLTSIIISALIVLPFFFEKQLGRNLGTLLEFITVIITLIVGFLLLIILSSVSTDMFIKHFLKRAIKIKKSFGFIFKRFWGIVLYLIIVCGMTGVYFGLYIASSFAIFYIFDTISYLFAFLIFIISSIIIGFLFVLVITFFVGVLPIMNWENIKVTKAIVRSFRLFKKNYWKNVLSLLIFLIAFVVLYSILVIAASLLVILFEIFVSNFIQVTSLIDTIIYFSILYAMLFMLAVLTPFIFSFFTVMYFNQRIRFENFGIELLAKTMIEKENNQ